MVERIKSLEEIYEEVDRESELEYYDKEGFKVKRSRTIFNGRQIGKW